MPAGAPTKFSPQMQETICALIASGLGEVESATKCGISERTYFTWKAGKASKFRRFNQAVQEAKAEFERAALEQISAAAYSRAYKLKTVTKYNAKGEIVSKEETSEALPPNWHAAAWLIERRFPHKYGRKVIENTGTLGVQGSTNPVQIVFGNQDEAATG